MKLFYWTLIAWGKCVLKSRKFIDGHGLLLWRIGFYNFSILTFVRSPNFSNQILIKCIAFVGSFIYFLNTLDNQIIFLGVSSWIFFFCGNNGNGIVRGGVIRVGFIRDRLFQIQDYFINLLDTYLYEIHRNEKVLSIAVRQISAWS